MTKNIFSYGRRLHKRQRIGIACGALIVTATIGILVYLHIQNSPQKIVYDAVKNMLISSDVSFEGTMTKDETNAATVATFKGQLMQSRSKLSIISGMSGSTNPLKGEMITDGRDTFLKINRASQLISEAAPSSQADMYASLLPQVTQKIDDKWIWIEQSDIALIGSVVQLSGCSIDTVQAITRNSSSRTALLNLYAKHPFFRITKHAEQVGQIGTFDLTIDDATFDEFMASFPASVLATKLSGCQYQSPSVTSDTIRGFKMELVIDVSTRRIVDVTVFTGRSSHLRLSVKPNYTATSTIDIPEDITRFSDIKQQLFKDFLSRTSGAANQ